MALPLLISEEGDNRNTNGYQAYSTYNGYDFLQFAQGIQLNPKLAQKLIFDLLKQKMKIIELYRNSFMPPEQIEKVIDWIESRAFYLEKMAFISI
jgi:serine/threonine-protein kinase HipA